MRFDFFNKKISDLLAFLIIILAVILAGGILIYQSLLPEEKIEIPKKKLIEETADWKTYRNEKYGYEAKYPPGDSFREIPSSAYHDPEEGYRTVDFKIKDLEIRVVTWENKANYETLDKLIEGEIKKQKEGFFSVFPTIPPYGFRQKIQVSGFPALKWFVYHEERGRIGVETIAFNEKHYYYHINGGKPSTSGYLPEEFNEEQEKIYNLFLSTFRFLK